ncbi:MAG: hypothetical protein KR126chlam5_01449 [Candidatus Anoxychlamydiales bacterium]|nr:hypothetical protein [Candidatus Anoxychlamydiales bacterium]
MKNRIKRQHYLSRSYLESFSIRTKKKDLLWVCDAKKRWRISRPENEAFENDFQSLVDEEGNKSDALETTLSPIEGDFKTLIRQIEKTKCLPQNQKQLGTLLSIMGLFAIRIPRIRERLKQFSSGLIENTINFLLKDKVRFEAQIAKAYKDGYLEKDTISYENLVSFHQEKKYILKHDHMALLENLFKKAALIIDYLSLRNWMVVEAPGPLLITSSKPVNPFWTSSFPFHLRKKISFIDPKSFPPSDTAFYIPYNEPTDMFPSFLPGFLTTHSIIVFPLTPSLALIGSWSPLPPYGKIDYCTAQAINWITANSDADNVYSPEKLAPLPWNSSFAPFLQEYHIHLGSRLITYKN